MYLQPAIDNVLVRRIEKEETTTILTPDSAKQDSCYGEVVSVGPGRITAKGVLVPVAVEAGNKVMFEKHRGTDIKIGAEKFVVLREGELIAVVEDY